MQNKNEYRVEKLKMIYEWQQSGLSQKAFCSANNIAYHVFHYWYGVFRSNQNATGSFVPLKIISPPGNNEQIIITGLSGVKLQFGFTDQSIRFIKQLLVS